MMAVSGNRPERTLHQGEPIMPAKLTDATAPRRITKLDSDLLVTLGVSLLGLAVSLVMAPLFNAEIVSALAGAG
jgi:hypothetical protein